MLRSQTFTIKIFVGLMTGTRCVSVRPNASSTHTQSGGRGLLILPACDVTIRLFSFTSTLVL